MFAIIETGGKQYLVSKGDVLDFETLPEAKGDSVKFEKVLLVGDDKSFDVGKPTVSGKVVEGKVLDTGRSKKIRVVKYKEKSRYHRVQGHRQGYTRVEITKV